MPDIIKTTSVNVTVDKLTLWKPVRFQLGHLHIAGFAYDNGTTSFVISLVQENYSPEKHELLPDIALSGLQLQELIHQLTDLKNKTDWHAEERIHEGYSSNPHG